MVKKLLDILTVLGFLLLGIYLLGEYYPPLQQLFKSVLGI